MIKGRYGVRGEQMGVCIAARGEGVRVGVY